MPDPTPDEPLVITRTPEMLKIQFAGRQLKDIQRSYKNLTIVFVISAPLLLLSLWAGYSWAPIFGLFAYVSGVNALLMRKSYLPLPERMSVDCNGVTYHASALHVLGLNIPLEELKYIELRTPTEFQLMKTPLTVYYMVKPVWGWRLRDRIHLMTKTKKHAIFVQCTEDENAQILDAIRSFIQEVGRKDLAAA